LIANFLDGADDFVPRDEWENGVAPIVIEHGEVRVANPAGFDFDLDFLRVEFAGIVLDFAQRFPCLRRCPSVKNFAHGMKMAWENADASSD
jgi:hypothetical protein